MKVDISNIDNLIIKDQNGNVVNHLRPREVKVITSKLTGKTITFNL